MQTEIERFVKAGMRSERSEFYRGYIAGLCDLYRANFSDNPRWLTEALVWYKQR
jgi:hypothetical protein